jgi:hypothetical protein
MMVQLFMTIFEFIGKAFRRFQAFRAIKTPKTSFDNHINYQRNHVNFRL